MQKGTAALENSPAVSQMATQSYDMIQQFQSLLYTQEKLRYISNPKLQTLTIHNSQQVETTQISNSGQITK